MYIINFPVRISKAAMGGEGTLFIITSVSSGRMHPHTVIFCVVFSLYYSPKGSAKLRWAEDIIFHSLGRKVSIVYSMEYQSFCAVVWFVTTHPRPRKWLLASYKSIQYIQGIERQRGGGWSHFPWKGSGVTQIIRQHRDCGTLYNILYTGWSSGRKTFFVRFTRWWKLESSS